MNKVYAAMMLVAAMSMGMTGCKKEEPQTGGYGVPEMTDEQKNAMNEKMDDAKKEADKNMEDAKNKMNEMNQ